MKEDLIVHVRIPGALILHPGVLNTHRDHLLQVFKKMPPQLHSTFHTQRVWFQPWSLAGLELTM